MTWRSARQATAGVLHSAVHAVLKAPLWFAILASSPKMPGGTVMQASVAAYGAWSKKRHAGRRSREALASIRRRTRGRLPDPALMMVLMACSGILLLPSGQQNDETGLPSAYGFASACMIADDSVCALESGAEAGQGKNNTENTAAAHEAACSLQRWWPHGSAAALIAEDEILSGRADPQDAGARFDAFLHAQAMIEAASPARPEGAPTVAAASVRPQPDRVRQGDGGTRQLRYRIRRGETISDILDSAGVRPSEIQRWVDAAQQVYDLDRVYAGQSVALDVDAGASLLRRLALDIDHQTRLVAERRDDTVVARRDAITFSRRLRVVQGTIEHSLYMAAVSRGIPDRVISGMAEVLGWELNFSKDLRPGDTFRVIYEELVDPQGTESRPGRVLAVGIENRGRQLEAFYYRPSETDLGSYYDREGHALGRAFLRYPVAFSRISSKFSTSRLHPVLNRRRPHYGVDFAAPVGTPVHAIAAGVVTQAGWHGQSGRMIKIRHDATYESAYAHLSRIASGLKVGDEISRGQLIGYVGSSGLATGPHLHLALYRRGRYVDPLSVALPRAPALSGAPQASFTRTVSAIDRTYARADSNDVRLTRLAANAGL